MKNKFLNQLMVVALASFMLCGCGSSKNNLESNSKENDEEEEDDDDEVVEEKESEGQNEDSGLEEKDEDSTQDISASEKDNVIDEHDDYVVTSTDEGLVVEGRSSFSDDCFSHITEDSFSLSYDQVMSLISSETNYMLFGSSAYPEISDRCMDEANYSYFIGKALPYAVYTEEVDYLSASLYMCDLPLYIACTTGNSNLFSESIYAFTGLTYDDPNNNPFFDPSVEKRQKIYAELAKKYGDELANEYFDNYQTILNASYMITYQAVGDKDSEDISDIVSLAGVYFTNLDENGDGKLYFVSARIDMETYAMTFQTSDNWVVYEVDMADDWNSYTLTNSNGFKLKYVKTSDDYLIGYVANDAEAFHGIVGIEVATDSAYVPGCSAAINSDYDIIRSALSDSKIIMNDGTTALDPIVEFLDGNFISISFDSVYNSVTGTNIERPTSFQAKYNNIGYTHNKNAGFALTDETGTYYFTFDSDTYFASKLGSDYVEAHTNDELLKAIAMDSSIKTDLEEAFAEAGITATIDEVTGNLMLDNSILFDVNSSTISASGQEYLDKVGEIYASIVTNENYVDGIKTIRVDGYADPSGDYDYNLELSEKRAKEVNQYWAHKYPEMENKLEYYGHSYDNPIIGEDGAIDYDASRRVEIALIYAD